MPSGRTHDAITLLLAAPAFAAAFAVTRNAGSAAIVTAAFVFGGVMFGPDLDTVSRQYSRWGPFRFLWFPYRSFFKHRSRFSHGLIFGALLRVVYFMGVATLLLFLGSCLYSWASGGKISGILDIAKLWQPFGDATRRWFGPAVSLTIFAGLWLGAASHTITDIAGSYIRSGRSSEFL
jgi:uncharacterized metal-binding protein